MQDRMMGAVSKVFRSGWRSISYCSTLQLRCCVPLPNPHLITSRTVCSSRKNLIRSTILTGSTKPLLNHILTSQHGKKIAVVENGFGDSVVPSRSLWGEEHISILPNGCLRCTGSGDLEDLPRRIFELVKKFRGRFDHIVIETTGFCKPVCEMFYSNELVWRHLRLVLIIAMVDTTSYGQIDGYTKAIEQILYADRVIINKIEPVDGSALECLDTAIKDLNEMAPIKIAKDGVVDVDFVMGVDMQFKLLPSCIKLWAAINRLCSSMETCEYLNDPL